MKETIQSIIESGGASLHFPGLIPAGHLVSRIPKSPCQTACPIDTRVKAYVGLIAAGEFEKAVEVVKRDNPFPGVCGRVCIHPCENECRRGEVDEPLSICYLKRFLADWEFEHGHVQVGRKPRRRNKRVAIIGSGPAGLTAANNLSRVGYEVAVFESRSEPGGMLVNGISPLVLPNDIVRFEIEGIQAWGVEIFVNTRVGVDITLEALQSDYDAVLIAIGAQKPLKPGIPGGQDIGGVVDYLDFLRDINQGKMAESGERLAIIGGDRISVDMARSAVRAGFKYVAIVYPRSREEMPVQEHLIQAAEAEGVSFHFQTSGERIVVEKGQVAGVACRKTEPVFSQFGRRKPVTVKDSEFTIYVDRIASTLNREPDLSLLKQTEAFNLTLLNTFSVDPLTLSTSVRGVFAAGDCATGPKTTIEAIASGQKAARAIDAFLGGKRLQQPNQVREPEEYEVRVDYRRDEKQVEMPRLPKSERASLREVDLGFSAEQAMLEAARCLKCGPCMECDICNTECGNRLSLLSPEGEEDSLLLRVQQETFPGLNGGISGHLVQGKAAPNPITLTSLTADVNRELCRGCGDCIEVCYYSAPRLIRQPNGVHISEIDHNLCRGCGVCLSVCESSAMTINYFGDSQLDRFSAASLKENNIVAFVCNWSFEMAADMESVAGLQMIRVLCSARITPARILNLIEQGARGVLGIGCYEKACHYDAVHETTSHYRIAGNLLRTLGQDPRRIRFERLSPDDPDKLNRIVRSFRKKIKELKP